MMNKRYLQKTITKEVHCSGIGVHSGKEVNLSVQPAPVNHGIRFARMDLPNRPSVPARFNKVVDTSLATVIGEDGFIVSTIEHMMAALTGLAIDNALVLVDNYELPIMDGSAGPFARMLQSAGIEVQSAPRCFFVVQEPIELEENGKFVGAYPAPHFRLTCTIEFEHRLIKTQTYDVIVDNGCFQNEIADARTFGFRQEVEYMKQFGLGQGGSLDTAIIVDQDKILNPGGLRYEDEFVRHKLLDCIGDFSLLGLPLMAHIVTKRSGHAFNHAFLEWFFQQKGAWQTSTFDETPDVTPVKQLAN